MWKEKQKCVYSVHVCVCVLCACMCRQVGMEGEAGVCCVCVHVCMRA